MLKLLIKTIVGSFYQQHLGLFFVSFYLLFGLIPGGDLVNFHSALLHSICAHLMYLLILFSIWILYLMKSLFFVKQRLNQLDYFFVKELTAVSSKRQIILWFRVYLFLLTPILLYASFVLITSIINQFYLSFYATLVMLGIMLIFLTVYTYRYTNFVFNTSLLKINFLEVKINKPFWSWPIWYLLNEQKLMLAICKIVSFMFFKAVLLIFADIQNDIKIFLTALLVVVLSHAIVVVKLVKFDAFYNAFIKNLPISNWKRLIHWIYVFILLLIPELILLVVSTNVTLLQFINCMLFCIGAMLMLQTLVYFLKAELNKYLQYLLYYFFINMFAIISGYHLQFIIITVSFSAMIFFFRYNKLDLKEISVY